LVIAGAMVMNDLALHVVDPLQSGGVPGRLGRQ
jgi:hypothetical protein